MSQNVVDFKNPEREDSLMRVAEAMFNLEQTGLLEQSVKIGLLSPFTLEDRAKIYEEMGKLRQEAAKAQAQVLGIFAGIGALAFGAGLLHEIFKTK